MAVDTGYMMGSGVITGQPVGAGIGSAVLYTFGGVWLYGGEGIYRSGASIKPTRPFEDSDNVFIRKACEAGDPCTFTRSPQGVIRLFVETEEYGTSIC